MAIGIWAHEPWRDEIQAWNIARVSATPTALLRNLRHEGHPFLWYALLWPFAKLQSSIWMLQFVQWCIAIAAAAVVLWKSPFNRLQRTLLLFGYFSLFEYGILARSYGLGWLFTAIAMSCIVPTRRWLPLGVSLGLLALTSAFGTILAIAILVGALIHDYATNAMAHRRRALTAVAFTTAGCVVAYAQARPSGTTSTYETWNTRFDIHLGSGAVASIFKSLLPLQQFSRSWWNTSIADGHTGFAAIAGIGIVCGVIYLWRTNVGALALWLIATLGTVAFIYLKLGQGDAARYYGTIWVAFIAAAWLTRSPDVAFVRAHGTERPFTGRVITVVLIAQLCIGVGAYARDQRAQFTDASATADWLDHHGGRSAVIVSCPDFVGSALAGYLERSLVYPQGGRIGTFTIWDVRRRRITLDLADAIALADTPARSRAPRFLVTNRPISTLQLERSFTRGVVADEHYWVYRITEQALRERLDPCQTP